jgi:hypothetical protein
MISIFKAPEVREAKTFNKSMDMWSMVNIPNNLKKVIFIELTIYQGCYYLCMFEWIFSI